MANFPQVSVDTDMSDSFCFGCGQNNPIGLKLNFKRDGKTARAEFTPDKRYQGWRDVVHGGIITCMLDEAVAHAAHLEGINCLTAKMVVNFQIRGLRWLCLFHSRPQLGQDTQEVA